MSFQDIPTEDRFRLQMLVFIPAPMFMKCVIWKPLQLEHIRCSLSMNSMSPVEWLLQLLALIDGH